MACCRERTANWSLELELIGETERERLAPVTVSDSPVEKFREFLEIRGEKLTQPRRVLVRHIFNTHKHFDADELFRDLHDAGHQVSRSTVYRTLRLLVGIRAVTRAAVDQSQRVRARLRVSRPTTICTVRRATGSSSSAMTRSSSCATRSAWRTGFVPPGHRFLITGVCSACSRSHTPRRGGSDLSVPFEVEPDIAATAGRRDLSGSSNACQLSLLTRGSRGRPGAVR